MLPHSPPPVYDGSLLPEEAFQITLRWICCLRLFFLLGPSRVSLRLGHARVLTTHSVVIHYARAASLRRSLQLIGNNIMDFDGRTNKKPSPAGEDVTSFTSDG